MDSDPATTPPPWIWPRAAYVHVPFCAHHCGYCDFAIATGQDQYIELYVDAIDAEMATLTTPQSVHTIFLGGGTPSHLPAAPLARLLSSVLRWLPLLPSGEFSIEANPESLDAEKVAILADHGVTRVSLGAQSFHPHLLRALDRRHDPQEVIRAVDRVRQRIPQFSLDLIFGIPGQTEVEWQDDLQRALALAPDHLSTYGLTYEKGTPLWKERRRGAVIPLDEDAELALYKIGIETLEAAGFEHYEISNFARPGRRCRHNEIYWANEAYFGFGMGAARYVRGQRDLNTRDLKTYIRRCLSGESPTIQSEELEPEERARETIAVQLRRRDGIHRGAFREQTGFDLESLAGGVIDRHAALGLLERHGDWLRLTSAGKYVADAVIERLL
jgi:oxygen-independent coproporphyrinogen-3 oxidase